jgi:hypothetical protein
MTGARCCGGASSVDGYFYATSPRDLRRLATISAGIHQVELGFEVAGGEPRHRLEQRLQRLHAECGCDAAAIAFLLAVAGISLGAWPLGLSRLPAALALSIGLSVVVKLAFMALARVRILLVARRLADGS